MTDLASLTHRFWSYVPVCRHGRSCRRCCWDWQGHRLPQQYGQLNVDGHSMPAMRLALILAHGAELLPLSHGSYPRLFALHRCDRPPCVNPAHGFWGTHGDNVRDERVKYHAFIARRVQMTRQDLDRLARRSAQLLLT